MANATGPHSPSGRSAVGRRESGHPRACGVGSKEQTKSQRPPEPGHAGPRPAIIAAGSCHIWRRSAVSSDVPDTPCERVLARPRRTTGRLALWGANDGRHRAAPGDCLRLSSLVNGTLSSARRRPATLQVRFLSSRSCARLPLGRPAMAKRVVEAPWGGSLSGSAMTVRRRPMCQGSWPERGSARAAVGSCRRDERTITRGPRWRSSKCRALAATSSAIEGAIVSTAAASARCHSRGWCPGVAAGDQVTVTASHHPALRIAPSASWRRQCPRDSCTRCSSRSRWLPCTQE